MRALGPLLSLLLLAACNARPPKLEDACVAQRDCAMTMLGDDCCFGCVATSGNQASVDARAAWCAKKFPDNGISRCPTLKCIQQSVTPYCLEDRCTLRGL